MGVFHFDQADTSKIDVLDPRRQAEIERVVERLARFRPTRVLVEWQAYFQQAHVDSTYARYRRGQFRLPRNETYQLGYRLAARAGLDRVHCADHAGYWLGDTVRVVAAKLGQTALLNGTAPFTLPSPEASLPRDSMAARPIGEQLRWLNDPRYQLWMHNGYINRYARVGIVGENTSDPRDNEAGADLVAEWYRRNIKIYREVLARTDYGRDRIVFFIGADHVHILKQLLRDNYNFTVVEANAYL